MRALLDLITGNWIKLLPSLLCLIALGAGYWYWHGQQGQIASLTRDLKQSQTNEILTSGAADADAMAARQTHHQLEVNDKAAAAHADSQARITAAAATTLTEISNAPQSDDAPVAPVLAHALDCLRGQAGNSPGAADRSDQGAATCGPYDAAAQATRTTTYSQAAAARFLTALSAHDDMCLSAMNDVKAWSSETNLISTQ